MKCPVCETRFDGKRCACGYQDKSVQPAAHRRCSWTIESRACQMLATSNGWCGWHRYWHQLIERGAPGRTEFEEFTDWWEQFQPWGAYASSSGQWWASVDVIWQALRGFTLPPLITDEIERELRLRHSEVFWFRRGLERAMNPPWTRLTGPPLPAWEASDWQAKTRAFTSDRLREKERTCA